MSPRIIEFYVTGRAEAHMLDKHGVVLEEAVEAAESSAHYRRTRSGTDGRSRLYVAGKTADGRRLWVVFADEGAGLGRIVTAREPTGAKERARHRQMRGD